MSLTRRAMRDAQIRYSRRFRRLPFRPARASQPSGLRLLHASNVTAPVQLLMFGPSPPCLAANMASADFYPPIATPHGVGQPRWQTGRPPRVRRLTFAPYTRRIYAGSVPDGIGLRVFWPARPTDRRLLCDSCSSGRSFAYSFLQTPPRNDALAVRLGVPAIKAPRGLAPPSHTPCLEYHKNSRAMRPGREIILSQTPSIAGGTKRSARRPCWRPPCGVLPRVSSSRHPHADNRRGIRSRERWPWAGLFLPRVAAKIQRMASD